MIKNLLLLILPALFIVSCNNSKDEEAGKEPEKMQVEYKYGKTDSLLWKVTGNGLKQPSYIFGTVHIIPKDDFFISKELEKAFDESEQLVLEIDMGKLDMSSLDGIAMPKDITLKKLISAEDYKMIEKFFKDTLKMDLATFTSSNMKPIFISSLIAENFSKGNTESYELTFTAWAKTKKKEIKGLETIEFQMSVFDSIPYDKQAEMLVETVKNYQESKKELTNLYKFYISNELSKLQDLSDSSDSGLMDYEDILLTRRNNDWIGKIEKIAMEKPSFFAVGALHLPGKGGILSLLREKGYTVEPVSK